MSSEQIYCLLRNKWVAAHPEEVVRQQLVSQMVSKLGFPASHLSLERGLKQMSHLDLSGIKVPTRRADLICFGKNIHPHHALYPLLLVECKAVKLTPKVVSQVVGYNTFLKAHFICLANQEEIRTGWFDPSSKSYMFVSHLPSYEELLHWHR